MVIRQRAMQAEDKQERADAILDAAERLLLRSPERVANVAEVADEAGLAKGTVYLYFPSKEELLLAVHERRIDAFFRALIDLVERDGPVDVDDMMALIREHIVERPLFLPLASRCFGLMAHSIPPGATVAFKKRMDGRLERAGAGVERHFTQLEQGGGVALLRRTYAMIVGLWQLSSDAREDRIHGALAGADTSSRHARLYPEELECALRALWVGSGGAGLRAAMAETRR
jgi:AcrR family transcriptional regulator